MKLSLAGESLLLFGLSVLLLVGLTLFESSLAAISPAQERLLTFVLLVLPPAIGVVLGVRSLMRKEAQKALAITGVILNALFALFHLMITAFAG